MNITLIAPPLMDYYQGELVPISMDSIRTCPPYGIYLLATVLRQHHHAVQLIDLIAQGSKRLDPHWGVLMSSHLIGLGVSSLSWPTAKELIIEIRRINPNVFIVLGGIHATMFDSYLLSTTQANFVLRGESEHSILELCRAIEGHQRLSAVNNLTYKLSNGQVVRNPVSPTLTEQVLADQPVPDYSMIPPRVYAGLGIESSRGCPFDCIFCSTSYRKSWRGIPPSSFVDKLQHILCYTPLTTKKLVQIIDDEFSLKTNRAIEICQELERRKLTPSLVFSARAKDLLNENFLKAIQPYAYQFLVGAECGYDDGLKQVGKGVTTEHLEQAARSLKGHNLASKADFSFVIGLPWETKKEVIKTVNFAYRMCSEYGVRVLLQWYCQIPGSRLWQDQRDREILHEAQYDRYGFFRDYYLFRTGVQLSPSEVHEVHEMITALKSIIPPNAHGMDMIDNSVPGPVLEFYPQTEKYSGSLANLREVAGVR